MKTIKLAVLYLLGLAFLLLVLGVIINQPLFDEDLLPEVAAIQNIQASTFDEDNAYPALVAIHAAPGIDFHSANKTIRDFLNQKIQSTGLDYLSDDEHQALLGSGHDDHWRNLYTPCNSRVKPSCMNVLFDEFNTQPVEDVRLLEQLQRYRKLIKLTDFSDATQLGLLSPLPRYSLPLSLQRLYMAHMFSTTDSTVFIEAVLQDMRFWRMVLNKSHLLLTKMVAVSAYRTGISSLSAAIRRQHFGSAQLLRLQKQIKGLHAEEANFMQTFDFEMKFSMSMFDAVEQEGGIGFGMSQWFDFFQLNATHNDSYEYTAAPLKALAALNAKDFHLYMKSDQAQQRQQPFNWSPSDLYNPSGKVLIGYALPAYGDYIGRIHDLNGMIHLLQLQIELALTTDQPVHQVIKHSAWTNPFTNEPMSYNDQSQMIHFTCVSLASSCELAL